MWVVNFIPMAVSSLSVLTVSLKRISEFLYLPDHPKYIRVASGDEANGSAVRIIDGFFFFFFFFLR
jgi:hypothetical protein